VGSRAEDPEHDICFARSRALSHDPPSTAPGATNYVGQPFDEIVEQAVCDARALHAAAFGRIIQNTHDMPFTRPRRLRPSLPVGRRLEIRRS